MGNVESIWKIVSKEYAKFACVKVLICSKGCMQEEGIYILHADDLNPTTEMSMTHFELVRDFIKTNILSS